MSDWLERQPAWVECLAWFVASLVPAAAIRFAVRLLVLENDDPIGNVLVVGLLAVPAIAVAAWAAYAASARVADRAGWGFGHALFWFSLGASLGIYLV
ncbi:MAG: hypothetical protein GC200_05455 [Tepidisphaera sp.]|nr:hypothetical protein [Tepidisphaera sp.]